MQEEFHGVIKLITGEEIFGLVSIDENDGDPVIMLQSPVIMKVFNNPTGQYVKIKPWMELADDDMFIFHMDKIITMTEIKNEQMIQFYDRYLSDDDFDFEIDGRVNLSNHMGLLSKVEDARKRLEEIFKIPSNNKEI